MFAFLVLSIVAGAIAATVTLAAVNSVCVLLLTIGTAGMFFAGWVVLVNGVRWSFVLLTKKFAFAPYGTRPTIINRLVLFLGTPNVLEWLPLLLVASFLVYAAMNEPPPDS